MEVKTRQTLCHSYCCWCWPVSVPAVDAVDAAIAAVAAAGTAIVTAVVGTDAAVTIAAVASAEAPGWERGFGPLHFTSLLPLTPRLLARRFLPCSRRGVGASGLAADSSQEKSKRSLCVPTQLTKFMFINIRIFNSRNFKHTKRK
jgi:hypothetical protein